MKCVYSAELAATWRVTIIRGCKYLNKGVWVGARQEGCEMGWTVQKSLAAYDITLKFNICWMWSEIWRATYKRADDPRETTNCPTSLYIQLQGISRLPALFTVTTWTWDNEIQHPETLNFWHWFRVLQRLILHLSYLTTLPHQGQLTWFTLRRTRMRMWYALFQWTWAVL